MVDFLQNGDSQRAFAASVFHAYAAELHRWLLHRLKKPEAADDVMQEVFARVLRVSNPAYIKKPLSYLFGIAFHVIREYKIQEDREHLVSLDSPDAEELRQQSQFIVPDEMPERMNLHRQLERALMELPQHYRTVVLLCKRDGMTYEEAAKASGLSVHTVEAYLIRAKAKLMALMWDR